MQACWRPVILYTQVNGSSVCIRQRDYCFEYVCIGQRLSIACKFYRQCFFAELVSI
jgi:hypothetical protein